MKMMKFILMILAISVMISCNRGDHVSNEESNRVSIEVRKTLENYYKDVNAEGPMAEFRYLDSTDMFSWLPPGYSGPIGFDSVRTILLQNATSGVRSIASWDSLEIFPEGNDKARYTGKITFIAEGDTVHLREEGHVIKRKDGWKMVTGKTEFSNQ